jgi:hypothetical protein
MRTIASLPQSIATTDGDGVQLHQFASCEIRAQAPSGGQIRMTVATDYPWQGTVDVAILETPGEPWALSVRVPGWSTAATFRTPDDAVRAVDGRSITERRVWNPGDTVTLDVDLSVRVTEPHPRVDAVRGCAALERGPLVYCIETEDLPGGAELEDVVVHPAVEPRPVPREDLGDGLMGLTLPALTAFGRATSAAEIGAIPYYAWGNRAVEAMRVWIPTDPSAPRSKSSA